MIKFGVVKEYDVSTQMATIEYVRPDACAKCGACGTLNRSGTITLKGECEVGSWVRVDLPDSSFISSALLAYGIPLAGFLAGMGAGWFISRSDAGVLLGGIIGLAAGLVGLRIAEKKVSGRSEWTPHIAEVYDHKPEAADIGCGGNE